MYIVIRLSELLLPIAPSSCVYRCSPSLYPPLVVPITSNPRASYSASISHRPTCRLAWRCGKRRARGACA